MKSFNVFMREQEGPVRVVSTFNLVLGNHLAQNIPLSHKMFKDIFGKKIKIVGIHILSFNKIKSLLKIQNTNKSISISTNMDPYKLYEMGYKGMLSGGGYIAKIIGDVIIAGDHDMYTLLDDNGMRWLRLTALVDYVSDDVKEKQKLSEIKKEISDFGKELLAKYYINLTPENGKETLESLKTINQEKLANILKSAIKKEETKNNIIKDYYTGIQKILEKHKNDLENIFFNIFGIQHENDSYNEVVVNNIKVLEFMILPNKPKTPHYNKKEFDSLDINIPVTIIPENEDIRKSESVKKFLDLNQYKNK